MSDEPPAPAESGAVEKSKSSLPRWDKFNTLVCAFVLQAEECKGGYFAPYAVARDFGFHPRSVYDAAYKMVKRKLLDRSDDAKKFGRFLVRPTKSAIALCDVLKRIDVDIYYLDLVSRRQRIRHSRISSDLDKTY